MENLLKFITRHADCDVSRLLFDRDKHPDIDMDIAVSCIESRRKLKGKVQEWFDEPRLIFPLKLSAEQCSSSATGRYKADIAERISGPGKWKIADLTGGLGVDSWFFSHKASKVIYNEMQKVLCDAARHNFGVLGAENIDIMNTEIDADNIGKILSSHGGADIVYMDPARRGKGGRKVFLIEDCSPDILILKDEIFKHTRHILIKLSPMADITMVCERLGHTCREVHVVSFCGECKELLIWMDKEWSDEFSIHAAEIHGDMKCDTFVFRPSDEKSLPDCTGWQRSQKQFLFEPGKSLMKAAPYNLIALRFDICRLGRSTHYYTTHSIETANSLKCYGKVFEILECHSLDKRSIKDIGKRYPKAEVTARNIPMDTEILRKRLGVTSGDDAHIFGLKSDSEGNLLIVAKRVF